MTREDMIKVLENERECVSRDCEYGCAECDLVLPRKQILETYNDLLEMLSKEEVESKRHGHWIIRDIPGTYFYQITCSECSEDVTSSAPCIGFLPNAKVLWDYCPYCGAKMDAQGKCEEEE